MNELSVEDSEKYGMSESIKNGYVSGDMKNNNEEPIIEISTKPSIQTLIQTLNTTPIKPSLKCLIAA